MTTGQRDYQSRSTACFLGHSDVDDIRRRKSECNVCAAKWLYYEFRHREKVRPASDCSCSTLCAAILVCAISCCVLHRSIIPLIGYQSLRWTKTFSPVISLKYYRKKEAEAKLKRPGTGQNLGSFNDCSGDAESKMASLSWVSRHWRDLHGEICRDVTDLLKRHFGHYKLNAVVEILESSLVRNNVIDEIEKAWVWCQRFCELERFASQVL